MDILRLRRLPRVRRLPLSGVLRGLLRQRLQGPAGRRLGDPAQRDPDQLPQLGLPAAQADLLRYPLRGGRLVALPAQTLAVGVTIEMRLPPGGPLSGMAADV